MAAARFIQTQKKNPLLIIDSVANPEQSYLYQYQKSRVPVTHYQCRSCKLPKATNREVRVPLIAVQDGRLTKADPDFGHRCHPLSNEAVIVLSEKRKLYQEVECTGKRIREACTDIVQNLPYLQNGINEPAPGPAKNHPGISGPLPHEQKMMSICRDIPTIHISSCVDRIYLSIIFCYCYYIFLIYVY